MNAYCQWCALPGASRPDSAAHDQSQSPLASSPITPQRSLTTDRRPGQWERTPRPRVGKSGSAPRSALLVRSQLPHCFACCSRKLLPASRLLPARNLHLSTSPTPVWPLWPSSCIPQKLLWFFHASLVSGSQWANPWEKGRIALSLPLIRSSQI